MNPTSAVTRLLAATLCVALYATVAVACSSFRVQDGGAVAMGVNYDWDVADGLILVNKRGMHKTATADSNGAEWVSLYGSVTVNQYGRELPHGGMNERGLTIAIMWLEQTDYPDPDRRRALGELEWIQYQLDCHATVAQVIASDSAVRIAPRGPAPIHYFVCDTTGACATVEFLRGKSVIRTGPALKSPVLTNNTIDELQGYRATVLRGERPEPEGTTSLARYCRAARMVERSRGAGSAVDIARRICDSVAIPGYTAWQMAWDGGGRRAYFRTVRSKNERWLDLRALDFDCRSPVLMIDLNTRKRGDLKPYLAPYTQTANLALMMKTFRATDFLRAMPDSAIAQNATIAERQTRCNAPCSTWEE